MQNEVVSRIGLKNFSTKKDRKIIVVESIGGIPKGTVHPKQALSPFTPPKDAVWFLRIMLKGRN